LRQGLENTCWGLALKHIPPNLCLLSSYDYRHLACIIIDGCPFSRVSWFGQEVMWSDCTCSRSLPANLCSSSENPPQCQKSWEALTCPVGKIGCISVFPQPFMYKFLPVCTRVYLVSMFVAPARFKCYLFLCLQYSEESLISTRCSLNACWRGEEKRESISTY
jgi:hypothetical protein